MKTIRRCEIVTNLFSKEGEILLDIENMKKVLSEKANCIRDYSYIIHDKDTYTESDEKRNPEHKCGELKAPHIHLLLRFKEKQPQQIKYVAQWFGVGPNFINKIHGRWEDACLYQIHLNAPDKFQYSMENVCCNFDFAQLIQGSTNQNQLQEVIAKILNGEISEYNKTLEIDNKMLVFNARHINEAFKIRSEHLQATVKDRNMECIFITGGSGVGKSTLAKKIARCRNKDFFISSGSNDILDGYSMQDILLLEDIRPSSIGLSDLLKLLDNHTASSVKSRYKNKFVNCELIILTTVLDIDTFYSNVFAEHDEPVMQLKRRCGTYIQMDKEHIHVSMWDNKKQNYTKPVTYTNDIITEFVPPSELSQEDVQKHISELIPFLKMAEEPAFRELTETEQLEIPFAE